jgi:small-conductance mechanosensitive channel
MVCCASVHFLPVSCEANTACCIAQVFENALFLFFSHPFDVGDWINFEGSRYQVSSITLQYVKLYRYDQADVSVPCAELRSARIHNLSRSDNVWDEVRVVVDSDTPTSTLEEVAKYVHASIKANPKWFGGNYRVWWTAAPPGQKLEFAVYYDHSGSGGPARTVPFVKLLLCCNARMSQSWPNPSAFNALSLQVLIA